MRLRPLTEAECYTRCYGGRHVDSVNVLRPEREHVTGAPLDEVGSNEGEERKAA